MSSGLIDQVTGSMSACWNEKQSIFSKSCPNRSHSSVTFLSGSRNCRVIFHQQLEAQQQQPTLSIFCYFNDSLQSNQNEAIKGYQNERWSNNKLNDEMIENVLGSNLIVKRFIGYKLLHNQRYKMLKIKRRRIKGSIFSRLIRRICGTNKNASTRHGPGLGQLGVLPGKTFDINGLPR